MRSGWCRTAIYIRCRVFFCGRELAELKSSLETIRSAAADIINSIDGHIAELQKQHEAEKAAPDLDLSLIHI